MAIGSPHEIGLWNLNAKKFAPQRIPTAGFFMEFSPDSSLLAAESEEGVGGETSVWKWDARDPQLEGTARAEYGFSFTSDNHLVTIDSGVFVERFDASWALGHVCDILKRNLTFEERDKYLPPGLDYKPTCQLSE